jgi:uncharacterized protein (DUF2336 family)
MAPAPNELVNELEQAYAEGTPQSRLAALWYTTDAMLTGHYSDEQLWVFGEVIDRLTSELELQARAKLADRIGPFSRAPLKVIEKLARDDAIEVAGPVLRRADRLDEQTLIEVAQSKSQQHLLAIAQRSSLAPSVTDVLVTRGNQEVVRSVAKNEGAQFSDLGFWQLVKRSENDSILTELVGSRRDIPRHQFLQLIAKASAEVRHRLASIAPDLKEDIDHTVADLTGIIHSKIGPGSRDYFAAKRRLSELHRSGRLGKQQLYEIAKTKNFEETTVAFSLLSGLPVDVVERALISDTSEMILILGKAADLPWKVVVSLMVVRARGGSIAQQDMDDAFDKYSRLTYDAAKTVVKFYLERRKSAAV